MQISDIFYSLQGEGIRIGLPTVFIRTTGCNLRCTYCDTIYAYEGGTQMSIEEILANILRYNCDHICLTGGEPLIQPEINELIQSLQEKEYELCIETNGSQPLKKITNRKHLMISMDIKPPSSHMSHHNLFENIKLLSSTDQLKCIIKNKKDYHYAKKIIDQYDPQCQIIFQPVWGTDPRNLAAWILNDQLSIRFTIQLHKILWGEKTNK